MKLLYKMTLKEIQQHHVVCTREMQNNGGDVFESGTVFEAIHKHGGLTLKTVEEPHRWIRTCGYRDLTLIPADAGTRG
jgi:hypothetical protein